MIGIIILTMLMASSLQALSPWLYISETFSKKASNMKAYSIIYQAFYITNLLFSVALLYGFYVFAQIQNQEVKNNFDSTLDVTVSPEHYYDDFVVVTQRTTNTTPKEKTV